MQPADLYVPSCLSTLCTSFGTLEYTPHSPAQLPAFICLNLTCNGRVKSIKVVFVSRSSSNTRFDSYFDSVFITFMMVSVCVCAGCFIYPINLVPIWKYLTYQQHKE